MIKVDNGTLFKYALPTEICRNARVSGERDREGEGGKAMQKGGRGAGVVGGGRHDGGR